jgi:hypothetical protein
VMPDMNGPMWLKLFDDQPRVGPLLPTQPGQPAWFDIRLVRLSRRDRIRAQAAANPAASKPAVAEPSLASSKVDKGGVARQFDREPLALEYHKYLGEHPGASRRSVNAHMITWSKEYYTAAVNSIPSAPWVRARTLELRTDTKRLKPGS